LTLPDLFHMFNISVRQEMPYFCQIVLCLITKAHVMLKYPCEYARFNDIWLNIKPESQVQSLCYYMFKDL